MPEVNVVEVQVEAELRRERDGIFRCAVHWLVHCGGGLRGGLEERSGGLSQRCGVRVERLVERLDVSENSCEFQFLHDAQQRLGRTNLLGLNRFILRRIVRRHIRQKQSHTTHHTSRTNVHLEGFFSTLSSEGDG